MLTLILFTLTFFPAGGLTDTPPTPHAESGAIITESELQLAMRDLWTGHIFWIRSEGIAAHYDDQRGAEIASNEAVENARAIADAVIPFYGQQAADQLFSLLGGHYGAVKAYMTASYAGVEKDERSSKKALVSNARELAAFLSKANPYLPKNEVMGLLIAHGGHHVKQIEAIRDSDFSTEAEVWEAMLDHIYAISDALSGALAKQFPEKITS